LHRSRIKHKMTSKYSTNNCPCHSLVCTRTLYKMRVVPYKQTFQKIRYAYDTRTFFMNSRWTNYLFIGSPWLQANKVTSLFYRVSVAYFALN